MTIVENRRRAWAAGSFAAALLCAGVAGAGVAVAEEIPVDGSGGIQVNLEVEATGELSMTVDTVTPVQLTENGSDATNRHFTGTLPTVTVTDTRTDIPENVFWSVVGQSSDFVNNDDPAVVITADKLGWVPALVDVPAGDDDVAPGDAVDSSTVGGTGLESGVDFLIWAWDSEGAAEHGREWQANAELELVVPADEVVPGAYTSTMTLSLFENEW